MAKSAASSLQSAGKDIVRRRFAKGTSSTRGRTKAQNTDQHEKPDKIVMLFKRMDVVESKLRSRDDLIAKLAHAMDNYLKSLPMYNTSSDHISSYRFGIRVPPYEHGR